MRQRQDGIAEAKAGRRPGREADIEKVHRRVTDEAGDEKVGRPVVDLLRRCELLHRAVLHHRDEVGHGHGFQLIMGYVDGGRAELQMKTLQLRAHGDAQLGIEIAQRLVHQEHHGVAHHRPPERDPLPLPAREMARLAVEKMTDLENLRDLGDLAAELLSRCTPHPQAVGDIVEHVHVGIERIALEHHGDVPFAGAHQVHPPLAEQDAAPGNLLEAGDHAQQRGLAAAARPQQGDETLGREGQLHVPHHMVNTEVLVHAAECDVYRHGLNP